MRNEQQRCTRPAHVAGSVLGRSSRQCAPLHQHILRRVRDGHIEWRAGIGPSGGFAPVDGKRFSPGEELVALYELRNANLIGVKIDTGRVFITRAGLERLLRPRDEQRQKAS